MVPEGEREVGSGCPRRDVLPGAQKPEGDEEEEELGEFLVHCGRRELAAENWGGQRAAGSRKTKLSASVRTATRGEWRRFGAQEVGEDEYLCSSLCVTVKATENNITYTEGAHSETGNDGEPEAGEGEGEDEQQYRYGRSALRNRQRRRARDK